MLALELSMGNSFPLKVLTVLVFSNEGPYSARWLYGGELEELV